MAVQDLLPSFLSYHSFPEAFPSQIPSHSKSLESSVMLQYCAYEPDASNRFKHRHIPLLESTH